VSQPRGSPPGEQVDVSGYGFSIILMVKAESSLGAFVFFLKVDVYYNSLMLQVPSEKAFRPHKPSNTVSEGVWSPRDYSNPARFLYYNINIILITLYFSYQRTKIT